MARDAQRLRRLRQARVTGVVPADLVPWLCDLAERLAPARTSTPAATPAERLAEALGDEIDAWMARRGVTQADLGVSRRTVTRIMAGGNATLASVAEIADALGCEARIVFEDAADDCATSGAPCATDDAPRIAPAMMEAGD